MRADSKRDSGRRDPRAEEDDAPAGARVDVVSVDGPRGADPASSALGTLRRELARLQQQAATVERTLDDHRRDRSDITDRAERASERASELERKLDAATDEVKNLKEERDSLALAVEEAKKATADRAKLLEELESAKKDATSLDTQLTEVRKRQYQESLEVTEKDTEIAGLKQKLDKLEADATKAKKEASEAKDATTKTKAEAEKAKRDEKAKVDKVLAELRGEIENLKTAVDLEKSDRQAEAAQLEIEREAEAARTKTAHETALGAVRRELEAARHDLETAGERARSEIETVKHELAEARAAIGMAESRAIAADSKAMSAAATAGREEARALAAEEARALMEEGIHELRRDVAVAFTRLQAGMPPPALRGSSPPAPKSEAPKEVIKVESTLPIILHSGTAAPPPGAAVPPPAFGSAKPPEPPPPVEVIGPPLVDSELPPSRLQTAPPPPAPVPVIAAENEAPEISATEEVISIPPEMQASLPPEDLIEDDPVSREEVKIAPQPATPHLSALASAIDSAWGQSVPPQPASAPSGPPERSSVAPTSSQREELLVKLVDPSQGRMAAEELLSHPDWLVGTPPPTFLAALIDIDYDSEAPVFELARAWDRESMCQALVHDLQNEEDARLREHTAWLLKHLAMPSACRALASIVKSDSEPVQLRRWLLEALDRLAAGRSVTWPDLGDIVTALAHHPDATIRDGVVGILTSLERSDEKGRMLMEILKKDDDEGVLSSAVEALASVLPIELDPAVAERLLGHKSTRVQRSVRELIERARRESRRPPPL